MAKNTFWKNAQGIVVATNGVKIDRILITQVPSGCPLQVGSMIICEGSDQFNPKTGAAMTCDIQQHSDTVFVAGLTGFLMAEPPTE